MFLVKPSYQILAASDVLDLPYSYDNRPEYLIEASGRTCYKSEDKITKDSAIKFIEMIKNRGHYSVTEHSWELRYYDTYNIPKYKFLNYTSFYYSGTIVAGNQRAFEEWNFENKNKFSVPTLEMFKRINDMQRWDMYSATVKFICDRGVSHEIVRHRPPAFSQESTRYCNYSKDKFQNQITYIIPPWLDWIEEGEYSWNTAPKGLGETDHKNGWLWFKSLYEIEHAYSSLIRDGWKPEQARSILPNSLKTEIVVSCDLQEWKHIFKLRTSSAAHPQMRELMIPLYDEFKKLYPEVFE